MQKPKKEISKKKLTVEDLKKIRGGRRRVKAGGKGSINGQPVEFPVDEF
jgi:hypothetical protein